MLKKSNSNKTKTKNKTKYKWTSEKERIGQLFGKSINEVPTLAAFLCLPLCNVYVIFLNVFLSCQNFSFKGETSFH